jgi:predicted polyphosphate/ATP-dependent NAD kinase
MDPAMAFSVQRRELPAIEVRVNFGVYAGREATPAEIDRLAEWLLDEVDDVSIISEERHEIDAAAEASVHQVRIEVTSDNVRGDRAEVEARILERAEHWARQCVAERHVDVEEL